MLKLNSLPCIVESQLAHPRHSPKPRLDLRLTLKRNTEQGQVMYLLEQPIAERGEWFLELEGVCIAILRIT